MSASLTTQFSRVAKILRDALAMDCLDKLYITTEKQIQSRSHNGRSLRAGFQ